MTAVIISLLLLVSVTFVIRQRFKKTSWVFLLLRSPLIALFIALVAICITGAACLADIQRYDFMYPGLNYILITFTTFMSFPCLVFSLFMNRGPIKNAFYSMYFLGVKIDVNKNFAPSNLPLSEKIEFIKAFSREIVSLSDTPCRTIVFKSHLITTSIRKLIKETLESHGASFSCAARRTPWREVIALNLQYGGRTRYRILSFQKHDNGFKVHRVGSAFKVQAK